MRRTVPGDLALESYLQSHWLLDCFQVDTCRWSRERRSRHPAIVSSEWLLGEVTLVVGPRRAACSGRKRGPDRVGPPFVIPGENLLYSVKAPASPAHRSAPCRACGLAAVPGAGRRVLRSGALTGALLERIWSDSDAPDRRAERELEVLTTSRRP